MQNEAQGLDVAGNFRSRYEILSGQFRPNLDEEDDLITLRTSICADYGAAAVRLAAEVIDSRAYDSDAGSSVGTGEVNALEIVQAYIGARLGDALGVGTTSTVQLGRFTMPLGSGRFVARNNFRNTTNAFTGLRIDRGRRDAEHFTLF